MLNVCWFLGSWHAASNIVIFLHQKRCTPKVWRIRWPFTIETESYFTPPCRCLLKRWTRTLFFLPCLRTSCNTPSWSKRTWSIIWNLTSIIWPVGFQFSFKWHTFQTFQQPKEPMGVAYAFHHLADAKLGCRVDELKSPRKVLKNGCFQK